jgi:uncharacterized protein
MTEANDKLLYDAIVAGNVDGTLALLSAHPDWRNSELPFKESWLHVAAGKHSEAMVVALIDAGFDPNAADDSGDTPLFIACHEGRLGNVSALLNRGADVNAADENGATPLVAACVSGHLPVVKLLVERGAKLDVLYGRQMKTAVMGAREFGHTEIADYLLSKGAPEFTPEGVEIPEDEEDEVKLHVEDHFGEVNEAALTEIVGGLQVMVSPADEHFPYLTLVTNGISRSALNVPPGAEEYQYAELVMHLPPDWPLDDASLADSRYMWPIDLLRSIAHLPEEMDTWYGDAPIVVVNGDPPEPYHPSVEFTSTMLARDTSMPPLERSDGTIVHFYTLTTLYDQERKYELKHGWQALADLFMQAQWNPVIDPQRPNLAGS